MSATAKKIEIRRPDLSREGASLRNSVKGELEWVFRLARKSAFAKSGSTLATKKRAAEAPVSGLKKASKSSVKKKK